MKTVVTFSVLFILIISTACPKSSKCTTVAADLIAQIAIDINNTAKTGEPFPWREIIKNLTSPDAIQCVAEAASSDNGYKIEYRPTSTAAWQKNTEALRGIGTIKGGDEIASNASFIFPASGEYKVSLMADSTKKVVERLEDNNYAPNLGGAITRSASTQNQNFVIIKVVPSDKFPKNPTVIPPVTIKFY
jgi:hypothetical protein